MVQRIDKALLRKRAEHNDGELSSLREVTLHQYDIEKIENLDLYCRHLEILFLQNNQISKIENVHKLKELKYLQLALNNVSKIENLEGCESLEKLDLTVNFVEDPLDVESLQGNEHLRELHLMGNPCAKKEGYREFVITALPQLQMLDGREITRTERIEAAQVFEEIRARFVRERSGSKAESEGSKAESEGVDASGTSEVKKVEEAPDQQINAAPTTGHAQSSKSKVEDVKELPESHGKGMVGASEEVVETTEDALEKKRWKFQNEPVPHTPATRLEAARDLAEMKGTAIATTTTTPPTPPVLTAPDGRVLQKNQGKWTYHFSTTPTTVTLHVELSKFLDTSLIDVDVHPTWVRVTVKGKVLQLVMDEEVETANVICERSTVSGWLAVTMAKKSAVGDIVELRRREAVEREKEERRKRVEREREETKRVGEKLLLSGNVAKKVDYTKIVEENAKKAGAGVAWNGIYDRNFTVAPPEVPEGFRDDPDVPPLC
ncbi:uncharacterized protein EV422DRAFT_148800 [Fimicolochytrium jonesii]|uniref:uncharacterized protein n=1 Tax=Fimicolochytrium jonesii TaxID=1396493 RepID=UPI0022FDDEBC|nr:uncharacterized protein EV422DRAFT_148800 [Fimicolochytrium jonesii]KAI8825985.1 hypothetical protein EV422DRAFT_148800 [Fimicolochytrium jonesii]